MIAFRQSAFLLSCLGLALAASPVLGEPEIRGLHLRGVSHGKGKSRPPAMAPSHARLAQVRFRPDLTEPSAMPLPEMELREVASQPAYHAPVERLRGTRYPAAVTQEPLADASALVTEALGNSDKLRGAGHEVQAARARVWKAWSGYVPLVTGSVWVGRDPYAAPDLSDPGRTATISASMPLFDAGQTLNNSRAAARNASAAAAERRGVRDQVALDTLNAVIELDVGRRQRAALQRGVEALLGLRSAVIARIEAGFASEAELAEVDADIAEARNTLVGAEAAQARASTQLASLVGRPVGTGYRVPDFSRIMDEGIESLRAQARMANPGLEASWHRAEAARYSSYSAMGRYMPRLDLKVDYKTVKNYRTTNSGEGWTVGLALKVPLVEAGTLADVAEARETATAARYRAMDKGRELDSQIEIEWTAHRNTGRQLAILEGKVRALERALAARKAQFSAGLAPLEDVLTINRRVVAARVEVIDAAARRHATAVSIAARAGRIDHLVQGL